MARFYHNDFTMDTTMELVFQSQSMRSLIERARQIADADGNVLITGECGTGKKMLARLMHEWSRPLDSPLICIDATTLSPSLMSDASSLNGPLPDGLQRLQHLSAMAVGGTVLLDEITHLTPVAQHIVLSQLRALETSRVPQSGGVGRGMRIISTTRSSLSEIGHEEILIGELFHRLYVLHLGIPPLRDRAEDIPILAKHFLSVFRQQHMVSTMGLETDAITRLQQHDWPGNVREFRNTLYRACFIARRELLSVDDVEASLMPTATEAPGAYDAMRLDEIERRVILRRLDRFHGNKAHAAHDLGVTDRTLRNKMRQYREKGLIE